jgi:hypothetical protein
MLGIAMLLAVAGAAMARFAVAAGGVNIQTPPLRTGQATYMDADGDGVNDPEELIGTFTVYDGNKSIDFSWTPYAFGSGVNGSYRVSMIQNLNPLGTAIWKEVTVGHHWASNPNGASYTMGPFAPSTCTYCPTHFVVQPETYVQYYDPTTQTYEYEYTAIPGALTGAPAALENSEEFVLEIIYVAPPEGGAHDKCVSCENACNSVQNQCENEICGGEPCEECDFYSECVAECSTGEIDQLFEQEFGICIDDGGGSDCQDAWATYCSIVAPPEEYEDCLAEYESAAEQGFCEECADDPESCAIGAPDYTNYSQNR